ncbi:MAG: 2-succinyl-5-enolpyruvyl-6-hydroxy-3-cyclohexene-carboxylate synthase [Solirubrobacteraceae bacterium]|nr:2-succinyl-5-enolpyruvyl-6-hydroxy-3-cyclohexene-carboxylate synthase [Solirubrobacteraceae bacterium]
MTETTDTYLLLRAFVDELVRCGVTGACTSPGSRSTPLVLSLVRDGRLPCWSHVDERVAAFFALGAAKASGRPVAVTCTSGTAAAHYLPAVVEAREARVPLLVLTADRPPELRDVGAGQAIDQLKLYGDHVKWFFEVGTHAATPQRMRWMRALACRAVWTALYDRPGPVHLNFPLREPLVLDAPLPEDEPGGGGRPDGRPWTTREPPAPNPGTEGAALRQALEGADRGVVVAGRDERAGPRARMIAAFAERTGFALLADPLSGARRGGAAIAHYDALLRDEAFAAEHVPDLVIRVGDLPTSKPLRQWLAGLDGVRQIAFDPEGAWQDPAAVVTEWDPFDPATALAAALPPEPLLDRLTERGWLDGWRSADAAAAAAIEATLGTAALSEPAVAALLADLPPGSTVFTASSMPVRDVETFSPVRDDPPRVLAHRGANGIDGTVAAAFGAAAAGDGPVVLHIGDVALTHDLGALLSAPRLGIGITIVLVDNGGGGIFDFLSVATQTDAFEEHVATPTGLDFGRAAALFDLEYAAPATLPELRAALERAIGGEPTATTLLHVHTDRAENVRLHRAVWEAVSAAVRASR